MFGHFQIPIITPGEELPQVVLDAKIAKSFKWDSAIVLHDETFGKRFPSISFNSP